VSVGGFEGARGGEGPGPAPRRRKGGNACRPVPRFAVASKATTRALASQPALAWLSHICILCFWRDLSTVFGAVGTRCRTCGLRSSFLAPWGCAGRACVMGLNGRHAAAVSG
jgi:hypothetical protein